MPSKRRKYNARFPSGRIKKIMQTDEEIGKVAQAVPVIISRTLELFVESLLQQTMKITSAKNAKTLSPSHMKQCIISESRFDFLKDLVKGLPDVNTYEDEMGGSVADNNDNSSGAPEASVQSLSFSNFSGPRNSCGSSSTNSGNSSNHQKTRRSKEESESEDSESVETDKVDGDAENNSDFVIDEDYDD